MPTEINALRVEQQALAAKMSAPEYFRQSADVLRDDWNAEIRSSHEARNLFSPTPDLLFILRQLEKGK